MSPGLHAAAISVEIYWY